MCDGPIHFDSGGSVYTLYGTVLCRTLLIVSEYRGDLVYKNSAMRATVRAAVWECGKDLMREPAFDLAFRITITTGCVRRAPTRAPGSRLIAVPDRLLNFWK